MPMEVGVKLPISPFRGMDPDNASYRNNTTDSLKIVKHIRIPVRSIYQKEGNRPYAQERSYRYFIQKAE